MATKELLSFAIDDHRMMPSFSTLIGTEVAHEGK